MKLQIPTTPSHYFRFLLEILSAWKPFSDLRDRQKDLFAQFLYYNYIYRDIPKEERFMLIFGNMVKKKIEHNIKMSRATIDTNLTLLRKMGFVTQDNSIPANYLFPYKAPFIVEFKEEESNEN